MKLIGYIRVSTDAQADDGYSLAAQRDAIHGWCRMLGHELVDIAEDRGESAYKRGARHRPGLRRALNVVMEGKADGLVVVDVDRLARRLKDLCDLCEVFRERGKALMAVRQQLDTSTATGMLLVHVLGSFAEFESAHRSEKTRAGMERARREGKTFGRPARVWTDEERSMAWNAMLQAKNTEHARRIYARWSGEELSRALFQRLAQSSAG